MSLVMTARLPIVDGTVTPKNDPETYLVQDILNDDDTYHEFAASLGGDDVDLGYWPNDDFSFRLAFEVQNEILLVRIVTDLPEDYHARS